MEHSRLDYSIFHILTNISPEYIKSLWNLNLTCWWWCIHISSPLSEVRAQSQFVADTKARHWWNKGNIRTEGDFNGITISNLIHWNPCRIEKEKSSFLEDQCVHICDKYPHLVAESTNNTTVGGSKQQYTIRHKHMQWYWLIHQDKVQFIIAWSTFVTVCFCYCMTEQHPTHTPPLHCLTTQCWLHELQRLHTETTSWVLFCKQALLSPSWFNTLNDSNVPFLKQVIVDLKAQNKTQLRG